MAYNKNDILYPLAKLRKLFASKAEAHALKLAIQNGLQGVLKYRGAVPAYGDLPGEPAQWDFYQTEDTGIDWYWDGRQWDQLDFTISVDPVPEENSIHPVSSGGVYVALRELELTPGPQGPAGPGVPVGGAEGQLLAKTAGADYATAWVNPPAGGSGGADFSVVNGPAGLETAETTFAWVRQGSKPVPLGFEPQTDNAYDQEHHTGLDFDSESETFFEDMAALPANHAPMALRAAPEIAYMPLGEAEADPFCFFRVRDGVFIFTTNRELAPLFPGHDHVPVAMHLSSTEGLKYYLHFWAGSAYEMMLGWMPGWRVIEDEAWNFVGPDELAFVTDLIVQNGDTPEGFWPSIIQEGGAFGGPYTRVDDWYLFGEPYAVKVEKNLIGRLEAFTVAQNNFAKQLSTLQRALGDPPFEVINCTLGSVWWAHIDSGKRYWINIEYGAPVDIILHDRVIEPGGAGAFSAGISKEFSFVVRLNPDPSGSGTHSSIGYMASDSGTLAIRYPAGLALNTWQAGKIYGVTVRDGLVDVKVYDI